ncbi:MAG: hypothetical protein LBS52_01790 [Dysgonamonadaceae bacterium]|jgi:hypothetical protein|nr:hypothetical protein [Dysgonamonadaceae bacterium]
MAKFFNYFFGKNQTPILCWFIACLTFVLSEISQHKTFGDIAFIIFGIGLLVVLIFAIYSFTKKKWLAGSLSLAIFGGTIVAVIFYGFITFFIEQHQPDNFATNLKIPENIPLEEALDTRSDSLSNETNFQLYNSFQPGLYGYAFWTTQIESGTIYLKAFEITQGYALSADRLSKSSSVKVYNPADGVMKFGTTSHFTIYEGDWGQPYAARFEVWFKPDNGGQERKLVEKNYKIEGWQR